MPDGHLAVDLARQPDLVARAGQLQGDVGPRLRRRRRPAPVRAAAGPGCGSRCECSCRIPGSSSRGHVRDPRMVLAAGRHHDVVGSAARRRGRHEVVPSLEPVHPRHAARRVPHVDAVPLDVRLEVVGHLVPVGTASRRRRERHARAARRPRRGVEAQRVVPSPPLVTDPGVAVEHDQRCLAAAQVVRRGETGLAGADDRPCATRSACVERRGDCGRRWCSRVVIAASCGSRASTVGARRRPPRRASVHLAAAALGSSVHAQTSPCS